MYKTVQVHEETLPTTKFSFGKRENSDSVCEMITGGKQIFFFRKIVHISSRAHKKLFTSCSVDSLARDLFLFEKGTTFSVFCAV